VKTQAQDSQTLRLFRWIKNWSTIIIVGFSTLILILILALASYFIINQSSDGKELSNFFVKIKNVSEF
jgi:hypothetical protein